MQDSSSLNLSIDT